MSGQLVHEGRQRGRTVARHGKEGQSKCSDIMYLAVRYIMSMRKCLPAVRALPFQGQLLRHKEIPVRHKVSAKLRGKGYQCARQHHFL